MEKKLYRDESRKTIAGVCAGLADYFGIDVTIIRILFVLTLVFHGGGLLPYIVLWIVMPKRYGSVNNPVVDYQVHNENNPYTKSGAQVQPKNNRDIALIGGIVLILLGAFFLLDQFDIIPNWFDFERFWPAILVIIGLGLIFRSKSKPVEPIHTDHKQDWSGMNPTDDTKTL